MGPRCFWGHISQTTPVRGGGGLAKNHPADDPRNRVPMAREALPTAAHGGEQIPRWRCGARGRRGGRRSTGWPPPRLRAWLKPNPHSWALVSRPQPWRPRSLTQSSCSALLSSSKGRISAGEVMGIKAPFPPQDDGSVKPTCSWPPSWRPGRRPLLFARVEPFPQVGHHLTLKSCDCPPGSEEDTEAQVLGLAQAHNATK